MIEVDSRRQAVHAELERVRETFAAHIGAMTPDDLGAPSNGTRWTNEQLLFHMLFGYLLVRRLTWMVKLLGRLPRGSTRPFAALRRRVRATLSFIRRSASSAPGAACHPRGSP